MSYGGKGSGRQKCSATMKITIWCCIQGKYGSHLESIHTIVFTVKTVQMQCYLVIWPWATTLSLRFFIGWIIIDTIYWVLTLSQACWGMLGLCYLMQSFGLAAPGNCSCAAANIIVRTEQDHGEKQWTQCCTYQQCGLSKVSLLPELSSSDKWESLKNQCHRVCGGCVS